MRRNGSAWAVCAPSGHVDVFAAKDLDGVSVYCWSMRWKIPYVAILLALDFADVEDSRTCGNIWVGEWGSSSGAIGSLGDLLWLPFGSLSPSYRVAIVASIYERAHIWQGSFQRYLRQTISKCILTSTVVHCEVYTILCQLGRSADMLYSIPTLLYNAGLTIDLSTPQVFLDRVASTGKQEWHCRIVSMPVVFLSSLALSHLRPLTLIRARQRPPLQNIPKDELENPTFK